jgi:hypothetical protein
VKNLRVCRIKFLSSNLRKFLLDGTKHLREWLFHSQTGVGVRNSSGLGTGVGADNLLGVDSGVDFYCLNSALA